MRNRESARLPVGASAAPDLRGKNTDMAEQFARQNDDRVGVLQAMSVR